MLKIPIVLASDRNCLAQMYITMLSAILNKGSKTFYVFICLVPEHIPDKKMKYFQKLEKKYKNVSIQFINMKNAFANLPMQIAHITSPTFYRLKIAELLPQYEKAIYLDIDTVVLEDLSKLYNTDLEDNYIGGVHAAGYELDLKQLKEYYDGIGLKDIKDYINAGVILWNLKQIRQENVTEKFLALTKNIYRFMDQDIINLICYGRTKHVDFRYNVMTPYKHRFLDNPELCQQLYNIYGKEILKNAINHPAIIHYPSDIKPWINKDVWLGKKWLFYAKKSPLKIKRFENVETKFLQQISKHKFKKIVFWGASLFLRNLILSGKIKKHKILGIIDKDISKQGTSYGNFQIYSPTQISKLKPDVIIFAIKNYHKIVYPQVKNYVEQNFHNIKLLPDSFDYKSSGA